MGVRQVVDGAVDPDADEASLAGAFEHLFVLALAAANHGRHDHEASVLGQVKDRVHHLLHRLPGHGAPAFRAVGMAHAGEEEAQVVVDLGNGAYCGARVVGDALLVNGDSRGEALDVVHIRLVHPPKELAGIGGEGLDVAALPFGVDGIKGKGTLARARDAGDNYQLVPGDDHVNVLEVVLPSPLDDDVLLGHPSLP